MRKGAAWIAAITLVVFLAGCTAPVATPSPSPEPSLEAVATATPVAAPVPTPEATPDPAAACNDCWPLTGKPLKVGAVDKRPLVVKIDNVPAARPHYGITQADMVFEILVEGFVTQQAPSWGFLADPEPAPTIAGMSAATAATDITIPYREDSSRVQYKYDAKTRTYGRWQNSASKAVRDVDGVNNQPVAASNVVIIYTEIWEVPQIVDAAGSHAHDMRLTRSGQATIFRDGLRQEGTWSRASDNDLFTFKNSAGERILFDQGQTWVHVVPNEWEITSQL